ncbi:hypothetical protein SCOR_27245 [Sulfidibacter corallicola]|uniref:Uncharacterized protein n=1 Tax=Sulfidibacter corallicola TaxID=2818388 RepID=A0A8A4TMG4_SULCO|nr:hypothetical protein [Sulfidibacter corallicola]QTD50750.1 hypothetical protein J3U87_34630 [Sulfidibacter corallicola]
MSEPIRRAAGLPEIVVIPFGLGYTWTIRQFGQVVAHDFNRHTMEYATPEAARKAALPKFMNVLGAVLVKSYEEQLREGVVEYISSSYM